MARRTKAASKQEQSCLQSRQRLARSRNNGDRPGFEEYATQLMSQEDCFKVIAWQQRAAYQYREHAFDEAYNSLQTSKRLLKQGKINLLDFLLLSSFDARTVPKRESHFSELTTSSILHKQSTRTIHSWNLRISTGNRWCRGFLEITKNATLIELLVCNSWSRVHLTS